MLESVDYYLVDCEENNDFKINHHIFYFEFDGTHWRI